MAFMISLGWNLKKCHLACFWKKGTKQAAIFSSLGAAITYVFCYYNVQIAGINAVVWGLLAGGILYFVIGNITCKNGLDEDIIKNCF